MRYGRIINQRRMSTRGFESLYPFSPNYIDLDGTRLHYLDEGSGRPVLMVHGNPSWSFYYRRMVLDLSHRFRTIVPDHIGCGFSDKPGPEDYSYTLARRVQDLDALVDSLALNQTISLILHDWGGMIGLAWALKNPERIDKIVITNTSGFLLPEGKRLPFRLWLLRNGSWLSRPLVLGLNLFSRAALSMAASTPLSGPVRRGLTAPYNSWKNRIATLRFVQDIPLKPSDPSYLPAKQVDDNLCLLSDKPVMILWGLRDFVFDNVFLEEWKRRFPNAAVHEFPDAGHYLFEDRPEETSRLIQKFLV